VPPTLAEVDAFLADPAADAYEKVVDRLLKSPRYGERMAYDWLDAARYGDSNGYQSDGTRTMWPWRDWVINAFNQNMPFDQFTIEQTAGDLLPGSTVAQKVATGFHRNHPLNGEGGRIAEESRVDYVVDRVETTATVWLGLTLGCARCHDHKYDPFSQKDFYRLYGYFNSIAESGSVDRRGNAAPVMRMPSKEQTQQIEQLTSEADALQKDVNAELAAIAPQADDVPRATIASLLPIRPGFSAILQLPTPIVKLSAKRQQLTKVRKALDDLSKAVIEVMVLEERPKPRDTHVLIRGAYDKYGDKVEPGIITSLAPMPEGASTSRIALARWLVDPANPLTARVTVNRYWQLFFAAGLVRTPEDFGVQGEQPTHPELLDWLAMEFIRQKWDVKALHRLIVTSAAYRQSSRIPPGLRDRDPDNRLLARGPRHRLPSPLLRDQALALSGLLVEKVGGAPVLPYQPAGIWEEMSFGKIRYTQSKGPDLYRRSLYTFWRRTVGPPNLFDTSSRQVCEVRPSRTNTPLHALITLNDVTYVEASRIFAERVITEGGNTADERIATMFRMATSRQPSDAERGILRDSLDRLQKHYGANKAEALKLLDAGESPRNLKLDATEVAAYAGLATLILNLDEVLSKE